jgi:hypothetical protein
MIRYMQCRFKSCKAVHDRLLQRLLLSKWSLHRAGAEQGETHQQFWFKRATPNVIEMWYAEWVENENM